MISVGSSDGRKALGLGFGVGGDMEDTELEEGEACYYQKDDDSTIDPDIALSYIDEKLQDVLGHFQKDFEGGVSAENLGAKFGGYGSFLPTYQRSPAWSQPKSPPKVHNYSAPRSPNNFHLEGARHNSIVSSSASVSGRFGPASVSGVSLPVLKVPSVNDSMKQDVGISSNHAEGSTSKCELINKSANPSDQKTLKVRIKMGSDNSSTKKNAEIYSGLGLDVSPSSSLDDSPRESDGFSHEPQDAPEESPTSILQIMTLFPVHGSLLLSPLPDDLICLIEKEKLRRESRSGPMHKGSQESSVIFANGSDSARGDRKVLGEKKPKSSEKYAFSMNLKNDARNGIGVPLKNETDIDTSACEELVSNALRLPLLSNSYCNVVDSEKGTARAVDTSNLGHKGGVKDESFSDLVREEPSEAVSTQENGRVEKPNGQVGSDGKVSENKKANSDDDDSVYRWKEGNLKGEKTDMPAKDDSNVSKVRKPLKAEILDPPKQKAGQKAISHEDGMKLAPGKDQSSSGGKNKSKGSQNHGTQGTDVPKDDLKIDSSCVPKSRKNTHANSYVIKSEVEDLKKDNGNAKDRYREFFGDIELDQGDSEKASDEMPYEDRPKESVVIEKNTFEFKGASRERLNVRKMEKPSTSEAYPRAAANVVPLSGNGPISNTVGTVAPVVKEDWVCCDKCQKWRLLPYGTNPDSLPEKWLCSMLNWLPGMNRCCISEEETTKALTALYQAPAPAPAPEGQSSHHGHPGGTLLGVSSADAQHFDQTHQDLGLHTLLTGGKKKNGSRDVSNADNQDCPTQFANSMKKNPQASVKSRSLNGVNQSPTVNEVDFQHSGQSSSLVVDKQTHKQKEKNKLLECHSGGGDARNSKIKNKRETDQDCFRVSKKIKTDGMHYTDEDWASDHSGAVLKVGHSTSSGLSGKDQRKYNDHSKESKRDSKISVRNPEDQFQITSDNGLHMGKYDGRDIVKKRKKNETVSLPSAGNRLQDGRYFMEETSENDHRKEKKARVSKSGGKETSTSKGRNMMDHQVGPDLGTTLSQRSLDAIDSLKRDLGSVQPSLAATSSSSKVSGSHKKKASLQEVKGSPVESVSSSPLRISNQSKFTSTRRNLGGKDDSQDAAFFAVASPRKCSDGEDDGGSDRSGRVRKDETSTVNHHGSLESSVLDFQDRNLDQISGNKGKGEIVPSPEFATRHATNVDTETLGQGAQYPFKPQTSDHCHNEERGNDNQYHSNGSRSRKSGKGSSSRSKDKSRSSRSEFDKGSLIISDSLNESIDHIPYEEKSKTGRNKFLEKSAVNSDKVEKNLISKKNSTGKPFSEFGKRESQSKSGRHDGSVVRVDAISNQDPKQNPVLDREGERSSKRFPSDKTDRVDGSGRAKSHSLPPSGRGHNETSRWPQPISRSQKENGANSLTVDASEGDDALKAPKQIEKYENQNGSHPLNSKHPTPNGHKVRDAPSPVRRDSSSQAATNAVKEAKDLKHLADRLKNTGSNSESTGLYFQAALKFLHGASLLESCNSESTKHGEMIQSIQMYSSTAKLCEFCAHEYEKSKDMATAALAYKCMEVAYLRVIYSSHTSASRDRHELQTALQIVPPGESPSSSASDVDNLNNPATVDKAALAKGVSSPQVAGNHVIAARNRPNYARLLNYAQNVNFAMEASRKSRIAFAAASQKLEEAQYREGISSVKTALDFNFQDVEGLLRLVRLAMEVIIR